MKQIAAAFSTLALVACATSDDPGGKRAPREVALGYLNTVWNEHQPVRGFSEFVAPGAIHHPRGPDGSNPEAIAALLREYPNFRYNVRQVFVDRDYVIVRSLLTGVPGQGALVTLPTGARGQPKVGDEVVDIFRIRNGYIVEHWDVVEPLTRAAEFTPPG